MLTGSQRKFNGKFFWLLCPNRTEVRRFQKNNKSKDNFSEYIFIDTGLILGIYGDKQPLMKTRVSVKIEEVREIYGRLISLGVIKIKPFC